MKQGVFVVRYHRFHLQEPNQFLLKGQWPAGAEALVMLDGKELESKKETWKRVSFAERAAGSENEGVENIRMTVFLPEKLVGGKLKIYAVKNDGRMLWYSASVKEMQKEQGRPQYRLDEVELDAAKSVCRLRGWAVWKSPINMYVQNKAGERMECTITRNARPDVEKLYEECTLCEEAGFTVEIPNGKDNSAILVMEADGVKTFCELPMQKTQIFLNKTARYYKKGIRYMQNYGVRALGEKVIRKVMPKDRDFSYTKWMQQRLPDKETVENQRKHVFAYNPTISIVIPLYNTPLNYLEEVIESIREQTYPKWELCLADGSDNETVQNFIREKYAQETRIVYEKLKDNKGISENTNAALELATGEYIMLSDHDDVVVQGALFEIVSALNREVRPDIIYTDEDKVNMNGKHYFEPHFKPDFNWYMLRSNNYICHIFVVNKEIIDRVGAFRSEFDGAQDYDFILRCCEATDKICHIPKALYHWRCHPNSTAGNPESKRYAFEAGKRALEAHYKRLGIEAEVESTANPGRYRTKMKVQGMPKISIIIPNKDHTEDLELCLSSIAEKSTYQNYEILVVENNSTEEKTFAYYREAEKTYENLRVLTWKDEFNYAAINNFAAREAAGEYLLFLNNDVEVITPEWMEEMLGFCQQPDVGIVGAQLYYPDDTIQHAGVIVGLAGIANHIFCGMPREQLGYFARAKTTQNLSAVTAACILVKRSAFEEVEGFDEAFKVAFNDIDLCMKMTSKGYGVVYHPYAELYHYESKSRGAEDTAEKQKRFQGESDRFESKWAWIMEEGDPYYNKNLSIKSLQCTLRED